MPASLFPSYCGCTVDLNAYYGSEVIQIDGVPIVTYISTNAPLGGFYNDLSVQTNAFLSSDGFGHPQYLSVANIPADNYTMLFAGNTTATSFPYIAWSINNINSSADILTGNGVAKRDGFGQDSIAMMESEVLEKLRTLESHLKRGASALVIKNADRIRSYIEQIEAMQRRSSAFGAQLRRRDVSGVDSQSIPLPHVRLSQISKYTSLIVDLEAGFDRDEAIALTQSKIEAIAPLDSSFTTTTTTKRAANEVPIITGDVTLFRDEFSPVGGEMNYWIYNGTTVLRLPTFSPPNSDPTNFIAGIRNAHQNRVANGANENLIIDVSGNGGGYVCLNYATLSYLVNAWTTRAVAGSDVLYSPYDLREAMLSDGLYMAGQLDGSDCADPTTGATIGPSFYSSPVPRSYGSHSSNYTKKFNWNLCTGTNGMWFSPDAVPYHFDKIIIITDGRCGSSCSYFLTQLRNNNKVRVVSYGGLSGNPMATTSFAGGNVLSWASIVAFGDPRIPVLPDNAYTSFNFRENFNLGGSIPRQFLRLEADWHLSFWDPLAFSAGITSPAGDAYATLYASVLPLFNSMPSSLARTGGPAPPVAVSDSSTTTAAALLTFVCALVALLL